RVNSAQMNPPARIQATTVLRPGVGTAPRNLATPGHRARGFDGLATRRERWEVTHGLSLSGASGKSPDARYRGYPRPASRSVATAAPPDERMAVLVPVGRRFFDGLADVLPRLEPTPFQRQRAQHLPPRLDQVQVRRVLRLEDELPAGVR